MKRNPIRHSTTVSFSAVKVHGVVLWHGCIISVISMVWRNKLHTLDVLTNVATVYYERFVGWISDVTAGEAMFIVCTSTKTRTAGIHSGGDIMYPACAFPHTL